MRILPLKGLEFYYKGYQILLQFYYKGYQILQLKSANRNFLTEDPDSYRDYDITLNFDFI